MRARASLRLMLLVLPALAVASCGSGSSVSPDPGDQTPPSVQIGTAGLPNDLLVKNGGGAQQGRARHANGDVLLGAKAQDDESGIKNISIDGSTKVTCTQGTLGQTKLGDVHKSNPDTADPTTLGTVREAFFTADFDDLHTCPAGTTFLSFRVELTATATNGVGATSSTPLATVYHAGPDQLRVATLNIYNPGLQKMSPGDRSAALTDYGTRLLSQADVATIQELHDPSFLPVIAQAAGMQYTSRASGSDVALLSKHPITNAANHPVNGGSTYEGTITVHGVEHRMFGLHWKSSPFPWQVGQERLDAATQLRNMVAGQNFAIAAGDLNVCGVSTAEQPNECEGNDAPGTEVAKITEVMFDTFDPAKSEHCSNKRIDMIFVRGPYDVDEYDACQSPGASDHPFLLATLSAKPGGP